MPNRVIREGINDSARIDALIDESGWLGEVFYRRLLNVIDDFGIIDARPSFLRSKCFPTQTTRVSEADVAQMISTCAKVGLVSIYEVDGQRYLEVLRFKQVVRLKHRKYPSPEQGMTVTCSADDAHLRPESNPIQSNPIQTNPNEQSFADAAQISSTAAQLLRETNIGPEIPRTSYADVDRLIAISGFAAAKVAVTDAVAKGIGGKAAIGYALKVVAGNAAKEKLNGEQVEDGPSAADIAWERKMAGKK